MTPFLTAVMLVPQAVYATAYEQGVEARKLGRLDQAAELLARAVLDEPENADAWLMYGLVLRDSGRTAEARDALNRALELAPEYDDAKSALASLKVDRPRAARVAFGTSYTVVGNTEDWRQLSIQASVPVDNRSIFTATLEENYRFSRSDTYSEGRLDTRLSAGTNAYGLIGGTIHADFRPTWQIGAGLETRVLTGRLPTAATLDVVRAHYKDTVSTVSPGVQSFFLNGRLWATAKWINVFSEGAHNSGAYGRVDFQAKPSVRVYGGLARAPDLSEGNVLVTRSVFAGVVAGLTQNVEARFSIGRDRPAGSLQRTTLSASLSMPFK